jgi:hypothetical protein
VRVHQQQPTDHSNTVRLRECWATGR